jgi:hypothetical protein
MSPSRRERKPIALLYVRSDLTDSMVTINDDSGRVSQSPGQKLFDIDKSTICTIAGFGGSSYRPFSGSMSDVEVTELTATRV